MDSLYDLSQKNRELYEQDLERLEISISSVVLSYNVAAAAGNDEAAAGNRAKLRYAHARMETIMGKIANALKD